MRCYYKLTRAIIATVGPTSLLLLSTALCNKIEEGSVSIYVICSYVGV